MHRLPQLTRALVFFLAFCFLATLIRYFYYPSYIDHVEPTLADLGVLFRSGEAIFPHVSSHTLHGLLYGSGLTELQSLAQLLPMDIVPASKLTGLFPAAALTVLFFFVTRSTLARSYSLFFFLFADAAIWNRAEPILGLLALTAMLVVEKFRHPLAKYALLGILAGACSSLKLHGLLYILPAVIVALSHQERTKVAYSVVFMSATIFTLTATHSPAQVDTRMFVEYLSFARRHPIVPFMVFNNLCYLGALTIPLILIAYTRGVIKTYTRSFLLIFLVEVVIAIVGAKAGAGTHHLLPMIFVNAYLLDRILRTPLSTSEVLYSDLKWHAMFVVGALAVAFGLVKLNRTMSASWDRSRDAAVELRSFASEHAQLLMGVTDRENYPLTFLRPILAARGTPQVEFAAYMDTQFAGLADRSLVAKVRSCELNYWLLPAKGTPFSLPNFYTNEPLLSADFRLAFETNYRKVKQGRFFNVYQCLPATVK